MPNLVVLVLLSTFAILIIADSGQETIAPDIHELSNDQNRSISREKRQALIGPQRFEKKIYYHIDGLVLDFYPPLKKLYEDKIRSALKYFADNTCIEFKSSATADPRMKFDIFPPYTGCMSYLEKIDDEYRIYLGASCMKFGTLTHEIMHSLGIQHQHLRVDRDEYIYIDRRSIHHIWSNQFNFLLNYSTTSYGLPYDYGSAMHYETAGYDKHIITAYDQRYQQTMRSYWGPSFLDILLLNKHYGCGCPEQLPCNYGGYPNPSNCSKCICPWGFAGDFCDHRDPGPEDCGANLVATEEWQGLVNHVGNFTNGFSKWDKQFPHFCHWHIKSPNNTNIEIEVVTVGDDCNDTCANRGVEFKMGDFVKTGFRYCCTNQRVTQQPLRSESNLAVVSAYSFGAHQFFAVKYRIAPVEPKNRSFVRFCEMPIHTKYFHPNHYVPGLCTHMIVGVNFTQLSLGDISTTVMMKNWLNQIREKDQNVKLIMHVTIDNATKKLYTNSNMTGIETNNLYGDVDSSLIRSILLNLYKFHFDGLSIKMNIFEMKKFIVRLRSMSGYSFARENNKLIVICNVYPGVSEDEGVLKVYFDHIVNLSDLADFLVINMSFVNFVPSTSIIVPASPLFTNHNPDSLSGLFAKKSYMNINYHDVYQSFIKAGVYPKKIVLQMQSVGHVYELDNPDEHKIFSHAKKSDERSGFIPQGKYANYLIFHEACLLMDKGQRYFDQDTMTHYVIRMRHWFSVEDPVTLRMKLRWFKHQSNPFGGVSLSHLTFDDYTGRCFNNFSFPLTKTLACELSNPSEKLPFCNQIPAIIKHYSKTNEEEFDRKALEESRTINNPVNLTIGETYGANPLIEFGQELNLTIYNYGEFRGNGDPDELQRRSEPIYIHGVSFNILAIPDDISKRLKFFVEINRNCSDRSWNVNVFVYLKVINQAGGSYRYATTNKTFSGIEKYFGMQMEYRLLKNGGFIVNDTVILQAVVVSDMPHGIDKIDYEKYPDCKSMQPQKNVEESTTRFAPPNANLLASEEDTAP